MATCGYVNCSYKPVQNSGYCMFHDEDYWKDHEDDLRAEFMKRVEHAVKNREPLIATGYNLPFIEFYHEFNERVDFRNSKFHQGAHFSGAKFHQEVDFSKSILVVPYKQTLNINQYYENLFEEIHTLEKIRIEWVSDRDHDIIIERISDGIPAFEGTIKEGEKFEYEFDSSGEYRCECNSHENEQGIIIVEKPTGIVGFYLAEFSKPHLVIFDNVNLSRVSFIQTHNLDKIKLLNVDWQGLEDKDSHRIKVFDEERFERKSSELPLSREDVLSVYRMLRDNYESQARYNEAGKFFISEMEVQRLYDEGGKKRNWLFRNFSLLSLYKHISMYSENYKRPLFIWSPIIIALFALARYLLPYCTQTPCTLLDPLTDSIASYFQVPRGNHGIDIAERIVSAPILGTLFIALKRKFERRIRR